MAAFRNVVFAEAKTVKRKYALTHSTAAIETK
ncbi:hypothetical protein FOXG_21835 [Fusarium oxysporum f. sp. lycopersici 4287]|uniref:Uncharacterized protein n=1 Tax=Fusarium oxysporum f. sp. lycopersici (strain 4287 / CBS 123668 / FGSC 9935 / NRRL 34936) TaxID=426428 RepID=A0A0J9W255_FUSO4|nr:hypothetical protein FOXG_21835 [Fusarium oxysporum f. sp. lycopersici 4287]KAI8401341.1 hypothetical protein FOFC_18210 [Fusarium oxysporum]KNB16940.1 hypothetical protein FOXG_21835 [Fusarium oxysporum f. sp. lycopersici 4287]